MFPENFLWGAASSSHQVEGDNSFNDWWAWEKKGCVPESSGHAVNHYQLFEHDFKLAWALHHNAHRFSIEWSRIEPREGSFNSSEIDHYKKVIQSLRENGLKPIVTLHHFTNPQWFAEKGGWLHPQSSSRFVRYVERVVGVLGNDVQYWVTINEPMVFVFYAYLQGIWPPGSKSFLNAYRAVRNFVKAHILAYKKIHQIYCRQKWMLPKVGFSKNLVIFKICPRSKNLFNSLGVFLRHQIFNLYFLNRTMRYVDFIGANYYTRQFISNERILGYGLLGGKCNKVHGHVGHLNSLHWDSYPAGMYEVLQWLGRFRKPIIVTENGTCENNDAYRWQFIEEHLRELHRAIEDGVPVGGYFYWSLMDNFEWHHGFIPRFGLIEIDYSTLKRTPRPSAFRLSRVCQTNQL